MSIRRVLVVFGLVVMVTGCAARIPAELESVPPEESAIIHAYNEFSHMGLFGWSNDTLLVYSAIAADRRPGQTYLFLNMYGDYCRSRGGYPSNDNIMLLRGQTNGYWVCYDESRKPIFFYSILYRQTTDSFSYMVAEKRPTVSDDQLLSYLKSLGYFTNVDKW